MKYFIIIISLIAIIACEEENSNSANNKDYSEYFPLEVGNWWIYEKISDSLYLKIETTEIFNFEDKVYYKFSEKVYDIYNDISFNANFYRFKDNRVYKLDTASKKECIYIDFNYILHDNEDVNKQVYDEITKSNLPYCRFIHLINWQKDNYNYKDIETKAINTISGLPGDTKILVKKVGAIDFGTGDFDTNILIECNLINN